MASQSSLALLKSLEGFLVSLCKSLESEIMKTLEELFDALLISIAIYPSTIWRVLVAPSKLITELDSRTSPGITFIFSAVFAVFIYEKVNNNVFNINGSILISHIVGGAIILNLQRFVLNLCSFRKDKKPSISTDLHILSYAYSAEMVIYGILACLLKIVNSPNLYAEIGSFIFYFWPLFNMVRIQVGEGDNYKKTIIPTLFAYFAYLVVWLVLVLLLSI